MRTRSSVGNVGTLICVSGHQSVKALGKLTNNLNHQFSIVLVFIYLGTMAFIMSLCASDILNLIAPLHEPRERQLPFVFECFCDQQKYFYLIMPFVVLTQTIGQTTVMASETLYMVLVQHACGLLAIAR